MYLQSSAGARHVGIEVAARGSANNLGISTGRYDEALCVAPGALTCFGEQSRRLLFHSLESSRRLHQLRRRGSLLLLRQIAFRYDLLGT